MILDCPVSWGFENLIGNYVGDERHDAQVRVQFEECVDCDLSTHTPELEDRYVSLRRFLLDRVEGTTLSIRRAEHADDVLTIVGQCR